MKGSRVSIFGVWQPFDDGSQLRFSEMQSNLSMLGAELMHRRNYCALVVVRDFNADFCRGKRYDRELSVFMVRHGLTKLRTDEGIDRCTYVSESNSSTIDHFLANETALLHVVNFRVIDDVLDCSDHRPIACTVLLNSEVPSTVHVETKRLHKFNWSNADFVEVYLDCLEKLLVCKIAEYKLHEGSVQERLDFVHSGINSSLLKATRSAEKRCGLVTSNGVWGGKCKYSIVYAGDLTDLE